MKKLSLLILAICVGTLTSTFGQSITVGANPLTLPCGGGNVNLTALGNSSVPVFGDDFNNGQVASGWSASASAQFNNPCGASMDGTTYLWMGNTTSAPRNMTTAPVDVSCGGTVCFDFKFTCELCGDSAPCEGADLYNEGVSLQCSTNGGTTWTDFAYFAPNGNILTAYPGGVTSPSASGNTPFTTWQNYCFTIPAGCETANTMFQLHQWGSSGSGFDHWGLDNFYVYATPCAPFYYDWDHIPGAPDSPNVSTNVTQTTTFTCCYTNGTISACESVTVVVPVLPPATVVTTNETCLGANDGTVIIDNPGGNGPYSIQVTGPVSGSYTEGNGGPDDLDISNLPPGNYSYTTTSNSGCTNSGTFTIVAGPVCCSVSATSVAVLCNGGSTGSATATPSGGFAPYSYQWSANAGSQTTQSASNLAAGSYTVTLTDNTGCTDQATVNVTQPTALNSNATPTNVTCLGACNGSIAVTPASGGTAPYQYNIGGGTFGATTNFTNLCAGTYNIIVQDANNCQLPLSNISITQPADLTLVLQSTTNATCGTPNGALTILAGGGTAPYSYSIGGAQQASGTFTGLASGSYTGTVTDANGCTETVNITVGSSAGPAPFVDVVNNVACAGAFTGSVTIGVTGGTAPYTFQMTSPPIGPQASNTFTGVPAGAFTVQVTDANGCVGTIGGNITQPNPLSFTTVVTDATCNGVCDGQIQVNVPAGPPIPGTPPYQYSSNNGLTFQPGSLLTGLCAGNIDVVVSDANGCIINGVVVVNEPPALTMAPTFVEPSCFSLSDGSIAFNGAGGTPGYLYSVDNGNTFTPGVTDTVFGIAGGNYDIVIQDANGCETPGTIFVTQPPPFDFVYIANNPSNCGANDGSFEIAAINGQAPYQYSINGPGGPFQGSGFFPNLFSGLYTLYVLDDNGCADSVYEALSDNVMVGFVDIQINNTCYNSCDGLVLVGQQFGSAPYTYTLNTTGVSQINDPAFFNLCAGTHYVTIEDNGLCLEIVQVDITEPDTILFDGLLTNITCPDGADGEITIQNVTGGSGAGYTYSMNGSPFQASPTFTGLTSGTYSFTVQDGNGCQGTDSFTLTEPTPWSAVINKTDLTCFQNNTGFVQVVPFGATGPYTYNLGGTANANGIFAGLAANTGGYPITITDVNGCTFDTVQVVNEPTQLTAVYAITDALCFGAADGQIVVTANGATPNYLYSSNNGVILQSSNTLTGLTAGCYDVYVEDNNGCNISSLQCVGEPTQMTMTLATNPATCGANNGDITITLNGGTAPAYQYSINGGVTFQAGGLFAGLAPGNYTPVGQDANGCLIDSLITVTADNQPQIDNVVKTSPLCFGGNGGSITITSSSGVGAHTYSINGVAGPFQASGSFTGLTAGTYDIVVEDANGCQVTTQTTILEPALLTLQSVATDLQCNGDLSGSLMITPNGGTPPYQYSIDNGGTFQGGGLFTNIAAANYALMVQDANGCQATGGGLVNEPAPLAFNTFTIVDPTCFGGCDGTVTTVVGGGTTPYSYNWTGNIAGAADPNATGVCAGTYSLFVTDANACQLDSVDFVLNNPPQMIIPGLTVTDVSCYEGYQDLNNNPGVQVFDGSITITPPVTGTAPYNYSIDGGANFQPGSSFTQLPTGNYDVVVEDDNGCQAISNTTIYQPDSLYSLAPSDWVACYGQVGVIQAFSNGGSVPYNMYSWTNDVNLDTMTTALFNHTITDTITFTLVVTDDNGCVAAPVSYTISPTPPLQLVPTLDTSICIGGTANLGVTVTGGQLIDFGNTFDYGYSWDTGNPNDTLSTLTVSPITPTPYTVTVTDLCGEVADTTINVGINPDPIMPVILTTEGCAPDTLSFDISGNLLPGYTVSWDLGNGSVIGTGIATDVVYPYAGTYDFDITITTDLGCTISQSYPSAVVIYEPPVPGFYFDPYSPSVLEPTVQIVDISQNAATYLYVFEGGYGTSSQAEPEMTFDVEEETTINVCQYITSAEGCPASICIPLDIHEEILFYVPNIFTPDGDLFNESFFPVFTSGVDPYDYHLTIFNRWGEVVFESFNYDYGWNGHYGDGGLVKDDVYIWQIEFGEKLSDKKQTHRGHVTVLK